MTHLSSAAHVIRQRVPPCDGRMNRIEVRASVLALLKEAFRGDETAGGKKSAR